MALSAKQVKERLLSDIKDKLAVDWPEDDNKIWRFTEAAQADLNGLLGKEMDYFKPGMARTLMLEHVFYNWNNVLHLFRKDYLSELTELAIQVVAEGMNHESDR